MTAGIVTAASLRGLSPEQGAALWLARQQGDGVVGDAKLFQAWLDVPDNRAAWDRAQSLWALFDDSDADALQDLRAEALAASPQRSHWRWVAGALAAAILLVVLAVTLHTAPFFGSSAPNPQIANAPAPFVTGAGQRMALRLPDGTKVTLDAQSALRLEYGTGQRGVTLERGRAFFDVAHDPARPFVVTAGSRTVTALGTRFDVNLASQALRVALVAGRVRVAAPGTEGVLLLPGQQLVSSAGKADAVSSIPPELLAWRDDFIEFRNQTLAAAAAEISRDSAVRIVVSRDVAALRLSGRFRRNDPERFARAVSQILPVKIVRTGGNGITLRARP